MDVSAATRPFVVVPVYNAADALAACLDSLQRTLTEADQVLIADDASTEPAVVDLCARFASGCQARVSVVRRSQNLGFVANINAALSETGDSDVVLLNSDTEVSAGWLDRLSEAAASDPRIATLTPWSNNAEICSFPELCRAAAMPDAALRERIAKATASLSDLPLPDLPTGVGFAMYIRRAAWCSLGGFDGATFGRGYGEENDFCLRAAAHGWRNALCATAYVAHQGGASFSQVGLKSGGENLRRLLARYPHYNARVAEFIVRDPLKPYRERLAQALAAG